MFEPAVLISNNGRNGQFWQHQNQPIVFYVLGVINQKLEYRFNHF